MENRITSETSDNICTISINRPEKRNALNEAMFDALANAMNHANQNTNVHCVILQGVGPHYSAGHDIAEFAKLWPQSQDGSVRRCISAFAQQSKPVVAAVTGAAVGFGATMLLHADWVVAGESTVFKLPFADLGIVPEAGATALLARRVGDMVARDWLLSARRISADEALHHRFVSCVKPDVDVHAAARDYALCLAAKPADALQTSRRLLNEGSLLSASDAIEKEVVCLNALIPAVAKASSGNS